MRDTETVSARPETAAGEEKPKAGTIGRVRLWNRNFLLLWQGHLVSALGDTVYEIALGFWILAVTGSTALMGTLMAASTLPRVLFSPLGGVLVDRSDRKWLIVGMDVIRGVFVVWIGVFAILGILEVWMVFAAGIVIGLCASLFGPAVASVIPDIVHRDNLMKGNSAFSMIRAGAGLIGNSAGGFFYMLAGAPVLFLTTGVSYLLSALTEVFIKVPRLPARGVTSHFLADLRSGFEYAWKSKGLRLLYISAAFINFFASIGFILILPLFQRNEALGAGKYGLLMACLTLGMIMGMILVSAVRIPANRRFGIFTAAALLMAALWTALPLSSIFPLMCALSLAGGLCNAVVNVFIQTVLQLQVPQHMRGKVFGLLETLSAGLTPIAMAFGGILGEFFPLKWVISLSFVVLIAIMLPMAFSRDFAGFIGYEPEAAAGGSEES